MRAFCTLKREKAGNLLGNMMRGDNYTFPSVPFLRVSQRLCPAKNPDFNGVGVCQCVAVCTLHAHFTHFADTSRASVDNGEKGKADDTASISTR